MKRVNTVPSGSEEMKTLGRGTKRGRFPKWPRRDWDRDLLRAWRCLQARIPADELYPKPSTAWVWGCRPLDSSTGGRLPETQRIS